MFSQKEPNLIYVIYRQYGFDLTLGLPRGHFDLSEKKNYCRILWEYFNKFLPTCITHVIEKSNLFCLLISKKCIYVAYLLLMRESYWPFELILLYLPAHFHLFAYFLLFYNYIAYGNILFFFNFFMWTMCYKTGFLKERVEKSGLLPSTFCVEIISATRDASHIYNWTTFSLWLTKRFESINKIYIIFMIDKSIIFS